METINLDIIPGRTPPVCHASQFDDGRVIRFNLFEGGTAFTLDGSELLTFAVRKPDGNVVTVSVTNTSDSYVDIVTTEQMCAVAGASLCELTIEKGAVTIGTTNVIMAVEKDPLDGGLSSASQINDLASQIAALLADLYDGTAVIFDNIPTAGHVAPTTVTSDGIATALSAKANVSSLSTVATSGDYNDLANLPTIPTDLDDLSDVSIISAASGDALTFDGNDWVNTPLELDALNDVALTTPASGDAVVYDGADWVNTALATVATSGNYTDLSNKPTVPDITVTDISTQYTFTKSSGAWDIHSASIYKTGNTYQALFTIKGDGTAVTAGSDGYVGTLSSGTAPLMFSFFMAMVGSVVCMGFYNTADNTVHFRPITGPVTLTNNSRLNFSGVFIK